VVDGTATAEGKSKTTGWMFNWEDRNSKIIWKYDEAFDDPSVRVIKGAGPVYRDVENFKIRVSQRVGSLNHRSRIHGDEVLVFDGVVRIRLPDEFHRPCSTYE
jgi:hypothetical protein